MIVKANSGGNFMSAIALHEDNYVSTYADFTFIDKWKILTHQPNPSSAYSSDTQTFEQF